MQYARTCRCGSTLANIQKPPPLFNSAATPKSVNATVNTALTTDNVEAFMFLPFSPHKTSPFPLELQRPTEPLERGS